MISRYKEKSYTKSYRKYFHKEDRFPLICILRIFDINRKGKRGWINRLSFGDLFDLYEQLEFQYKSKIFNEHPDRGGNSEKATILNILWKRGKMLFKRLGIEK